MVYKPPTDLELGIEVTLKVIVFTVGCVVTANATWRTGIGTTSICRRAGRAMIAMGPRGA